MITCTASESLQRCFSNVWNSIVHHTAYAKKIACHLTTVLLEHTTVAAVAVTVAQ